MIHRRLSRAPRRQPEKREQAAIVRLLRTLGAQVWVLGTQRRRTDYPGTMQTPGLPDLIASLPRGRQGCSARRAVESPTPAVRLEVEVKAAGGRLSPAQRTYRQHALACGIAHVVGGLDEVIAWLLDRGFLRPEQVPYDRRCDIMSEREP